MGGGLDFHTEPSEKNGGGGGVKPRLMRADEGFCDGAAHGDDRAHVAVNRKRPGLGGQIMKARGGGLVGRRGAH
jgi:hypothetical protein